MPSRKTAWLEAAWIFLISRLVILFITVIATLRPLTAAPRYMMVIFPILVILAIWGKQPPLDRIIIACSFPLFVINVALFINHYWVA